MCVLFSIKKFGFPSKKHKDFNKIYSRDGSINENNFLSVFGGGIEGNETLGDAVIREVVDEETNLRINIQDIVPFGFYPQILEKHGSDVFCYIFLLNKPIDPETLEVYEGQEFQILTRDTNLDVIKAKPVMLEIFHDYFKKTEPSR